MNVTYRNQSYSVDPCALIVRGDSFFARITLAARIPMTAYVKVDAPVEALVYGCELPPRALVVWRPTLTITPDQLWSKGTSGVNLAECAHVNVVIQLPEAA